MHRVSVIEHNGCLVLVVDYSNCRGEQCVDVVNQAMDFLKSNQGRWPILSIFNEKTYVSPAMIRHIETHLPAAQKYISSQAIIGTTTVQKWILWGVNSWYQTKIHPFESRLQALDFLAPAQSTQ
jgi:50S ribosomal subunit-associated GTPase HflX